MYCALIISVAVFFSNFLAAGPTVAIVSYVIDFTGVMPNDPSFPKAIAKVAFFFTTPALLQGVSNFFWMPLIVKYGRRPVYIIAYICYTITAIWGGVAKTYSSELASRILLGFFGGAGECLAPVSISDLFFLHERGFYMSYVLLGSGTDSIIHSADLFILLFSIYTAALSAGVSVGVIVDGLITINHDWRYINYVATALIGSVTVIVLFTLPETSYQRKTSPMRDLNNYTTHEASQEKSTCTGSDHNEAISVDVQTLVTPTGHKQSQSFFQTLKLFHGVYTQENLWTLARRSIVLIVLPPVLWATLVMSVSIGFLVAISSNFSSAFRTTYGFTSWQSGLSFISGFIGTLLGIATGTISDSIADYLTRRNGGIREPEMRLPAMMIALIAAPLALVLYGAGIEHEWHWMVPTLGLGLISFAIAQGTNVSLVYVIDCYRPIAGETVVTQLAYKCESTSASEDPVVVTDLSPNSLFRLPLVVLY